MARRVVLERKTYLADRTLGWLNVFDGPIRLYRRPCLELPWKDNENDVSCVPAGEFPLHKEASAAFHMDLWELKLVPARGECKVHGANYPHELRGCIAPGMIHADLDKDGKLDVGRSKVALTEFHKAMGDETLSSITIIGDGRDTLQPGMNGYK
jgi:hypothetical protein